MEGFGEKSYQNLQDSVNASRKTTLPKLIYGLGIANIGVANAKVLCRHFSYDLQQMMTADEEKISAVEGVGEVIASAFVTYMREEKHIRELEHLLPELEMENPRVEEGSQTLAGMSFVVTGSLECFQNRNDLKDAIEQRGGKVTGSVTGKTTCLINNDVTSSSSKNKKAKELGVPIMAEKEFLEKYEISAEV